VLGAASILGADTDFVRSDLQGFHIFRSLGLQRLYFYGRAQGQTGSPLPQDYIGFPRHDPVSVDLPGFVPISLGDSDRVRGYRHFAVGDYVLFGSAEYSVPFLPDLQTELLGLVSLGRTSLALFADAGMVWRRKPHAERVERLSVGLELTNEVTLGGFLTFGPAVGIAQPAEFVGTDEDYEVYYRIRAGVAF
jgi:outer membrane protein assembly factor BamA